MTARVSLACDGIIPGAGYPCRQAIYAGEVLTGREARAVAAEFDWSSRVVDGRAVDLCPACTRRELTARPPVVERDRVGRPLPPLTPAGVRATFAPLIGAEQLADGTR